MNIKEYSQSRNVLSGTVSAYIKKHKAEFEKHIKKVGKQQILDTKAIELLDLQYHPQAQVEVSVSLEDFKQLQGILLATQQQLQQANSLINEQQLQLKEYNEIKLQLDIAKNEGKHIKEELERYKPTIFGLYKRI